MTNNLYDLPDIDFIGGSTVYLIFNVYRNLVNHQPHDLVGCTTNFSIISFADRHSTPVISKRMEARMSEAEKLEDQSYNVLFVELTPEETLNLYGKFIYQITIVDAEGNIDIPKQGIMYIHKNIDKAFVNNSLRP